VKLVVLDTNVLVSALWSKDGNPALVMALVLNGRITPCFDHRILEEYHGVLTRPRFGFSAGEVNALLSYIRTEGMSVVAPPLAIQLPDASDKMFLEVATCVNATLITGNLKHFPEVPFIQSPKTFLKHWNG